MYRVTVAVWRGKANDRGRFIFNWIYTGKRFPLDNSGTRGGAIREMRERERERERVEWKKTGGVRPRWNIIERRAPFPARSRWKGEWKRHRTNLGSFYTSSSRVWSMGGGVGSRGRVESAEIVMRCRMTRGSWPTGKLPFREIDSGREKYRFDKTDRLRVNQYRVFGIATKGWREQRKGKGEGKWVLFNRDTISPESVKRKKREMSKLVRDGKDFIWPKFTRCTRFGTSFIRVRRNRLKRVERLETRLARQ